MFWTPSCLLHGTMKPWTDTATHNISISWESIIRRHFQWIRLLTADNDRDQFRW